MYTMYTDREREKVTWRCGNETKKVGALNDPPVMDD